VLEVPFSSEKELQMDILRMGADAQVLAPASLRAAVRRSIEAMASQYRE
jgi:predicted DNA-binding transcriptional regulator YafY